MRQTAMLLLGRAILLGMRKEDYQFRYQLKIDARNIQTNPKGVQEFRHPYDLRGGWGLKGP